MGFLYKHVNLTPAGGNDETMVEALESTQEEKYRLKAISFDRVASHDIMIKKGRSTLCDMPSQHLVSYETWLPIDEDIEVGSKIKVGYRKNTAGAGAAQEITLQYEIVK